MPGPGSIRYPSEFKQEAVRMYRSGEHGGIEKIAKKLSVATDTMRRWVAQAAVDSGVKEGVTSEERAEIARLRRRVRELEDEKEILRKATVFFVRESDRT